MNVYLVNGKKVVLKGSCGDNFGYVEVIETGEILSTYGYNALNFNNNTRVGTVKTKTMYYDFKEDNKK